MRKITTAVLMISAIMISACKKEGCTSTTANNYTDGAKKDDGTCKYSATSIFYFDSDAALNFAGELYTTLDLYIDNVKIGSIEIDQYSDDVPSCGSSKGINYNFDLAANPSRTVSYVVKSKDLLNVEQTLVTGSTTISGGACQAVKFVY
jgi:hypothetical protein